MKLGIDRDLSPMVYCNPVLSKTHGRPVGQAVKTSPFHGGNESSILSRVIVPYLYPMAQWYSWLVRRPVTPEVEGSSPF